MVKVYPAIIHDDSDGMWIEFPDLPGCVTQGDTMEELMEMAQEAMGLWIDSQLEMGQQLPEPSDIRNINSDGLPVTYVTTDIDRYRRNTKAIKRMISMPTWLAEEADRKGISLSKLTQDALKSRLGIA